jgi:hypothetical protein
LNFEYFEGFGVQIFSSVFQYQIQFTKFNLKIIFIAQACLYIIQLSSFQAIFAIQ